MMTYKNNAVPGVFRENDDIVFVTTDRERQGTSLLIFDAKSGECRKTIPMTGVSRPDSAVVTARFKDPGGEVAYLYQRGQKTFRDPYARLVGKDGLCYVPKKSVPDAAGAESGKPVLSVSDLKIYKLHVRGLTMSGIKTSAPGSFEALTSRLADIRNFGFTAVELMPAYAWDEKLKDTKRKNYWGYAESNNYFAPNPRFAATDDPIGEMRTLISRAHDLGLAVIMEFCFPAETDPYLGWQALHYWQEAYGVDGFSIVGGGIPHDLLLADPAFIDTWLIFAGTGSDLLNRYRPGTHSKVLFENDDFRMTGRAFLKGDDNQTSPFVHKTLRSPDTWTPVNDMANNNGFTLADAVAYDYKHNEANGENNKDGTDHNASWNCGVEGETKVRRIIDLRRRQIRNALAYVFLAQGVPLLYAGDESGNSQGGNNNAYCCDDPIGWVDPVKSAPSRAQAAYVRDLIALRDRFPILHKGTALKEISSVSSGYPEVSVHGDKAWYYDFAQNRHAVGILYDGRAAGGSDESGFLYVLYNADAAEQTFALPPLPDGYGWQLIMDTSRRQNQVFPGKPEAIETGRIFVTDPRSVAVLVGSPIKE